MLILLYIGMIIGNGAFIYGIHINNFIVMLVGRCFYGISAESFAMAETPLLYEYFFGKELSFALGFNLSFSRLGSAINDVLTYEFYKSHGVVFSMSMGGFVLMPFCLFFLTAIILYRVCIASKQSPEDKIPYKKVEEGGSEIGMTTKLMGNTTGNEYDSMQDTAGGYTEHDMSVRYEQSMPSLAQQYTMPSTIKQENDAFEEDDDIDNDMEETETNQGDENRFRFSDFKQFDTRYWLLVVNCCFQYGCVVPWMKIGGSYMQRKFNYSHHKSNEYLMIPYIVAAIVTPLIGFCVDWCGRRCQLLLVATGMLTLSHYILGWLTPNDIGIDPNDEDTLPLAGLVGLGLGYSVFCAVIWPAFAIVIPPHLVGTGYGIPTSAYNLVLGLFFLLVGVLTKDDDDGNLEVIWYLFDIYVAMITIFVDQSWCKSNQRQMFISTYLSLHSSVFYSF